MKKAAIAILFFAAITAIGGALYYYAHREYVFRFSEAQLQEKLSAKLPLTKTYLFIFQVTLDHPRVNLVNGTDRVKAGLDVLLNIRLGNEQKPLGGTLDVSGGVKYVPERGEFFLSDPIVEHLTVQGIPDKYTEKVNSIMAAALTGYFADHPIYTLKAEDTKQAAAKLVLKNVTVENQELVVILGI